MGEAKASFEGSTRFRREGLKLHIGGMVLHLLPFLGFLLGFWLIVFIIDVTYAHYIGSVRSFLGFALAASLIGLLVSMAMRSIHEDEDVESLGSGLKARMGGKSTILVVALVGMMLLLAIGMGGAYSIICVVPLIVILIVVLVVLMRARRSVLAFERFEDGKPVTTKVKSPARYVDGARVAVAMFALAILIISSFMPYVAPAGLVKNPLYDSLTNNKVSGENNNTLEDPNEVRVVSWLLATQYLERSYGDAAAFLDSSTSGLFSYTDPAYVNGRFVWVNAPYYEAWKWFGGKKVPFFVYVENDPANISVESTDLTHKVQTELETHEIRISWEKRLEQLCFHRYAAQYEIAQIRFTIDDDENPYWVVYLAERDLVYNMLHLEKLLVVDATSMDRNWEYDITSADIPEWLEVVYPDSYVYEWVWHWAEYRLGLGYRWFNKAHLYEPDDEAARFIVIRGTTYWQVPLVQKTSHVLGGYVWVNTRTGEATFYNREDRSLADKDTVEAQIQKYLSSGALGYQRLDIHEGYLYPFRLNDGTQREAYVFPLYAGLTVTRYAVVDAVDYTSEPVIENDLALALERYRSRGGGTGGDVLEWDDYTLTSGHVEGDEAVLSVSNATETNLTVVFTSSDLQLGLLASGEDEMREVSLAVAAWSRGDDVTLRLVM
ncbi:MAG: hypothetical protein GWN18_06050, partial [Thermoplasmata archaeon]|nr:hypothetical protein [Thermoplasmata archaeon]NIS11612.1 hypothetical protein [Thermoplasmata archaeon]NIS19531.1 hypothetical protein [Thermoplasmata archaeon]NIT76100.1 hypothetical protein [Thermoplasmata archaeon]NIU48647.1 hypothetical protein [Thermoplasmata archaeon]